MMKHEAIWREQCDATLTIHARHGEKAALDYLIGEKLLHYTSVARKSPAFATQLPSFVAHVRQMFAREVMLHYIADLEARLISESHEVDPEDVTLASGAINDLESLRQIVDLLRVEQLGTA